MKPLIDLIRTKSSQRVPIWFMRQAGRYLPEYRALRAQQPDFLKFCYTPKLAVEATLQPLKRYDLDAAILFSDILVVPHALGQHVGFEEGVGPILGDFHLKNLKIDRLEQTLSPVFEILTTLRACLPPHISLIGFSGAPWTLYCYMIEGRGKRGFSKAIAWGQENPQQFREVMELLTDAVVAYLKHQVRAGAEVVQLFDTWAGEVPQDLYEIGVVKPVTKIVKELKAFSAQVPLMGFPKNIGERIVPYVKETGIDVLSLDPTFNPEALAQILPQTVYQGGLDPELVVLGGEAMIKEADTYLKAFKDRPYIFNLGHGLLPKTPPENVQKLIDHVRKMDVDG